MANIFPRQTRIAAAFIFAAALSFMVGAPSGARADEAAAKGLVKAMSDYLAAQKAISFSYDTDREVVTRDGQKLAVANSGTVTVNRPDKAHVTRHGYAVFDCDAFDRNKRNHVGGAHARMRALMLRQVDQLRGLPYPADRRFLNRVAVADQSDHAAVVVGIHLAVEELDTRDFHGVDNGVDFGFVAAFGEIRDTFDESAGHTPEA